eukprot:572862-Pelagomonas_calceolata.AAC.1
MEPGASNDPPDPHQGLLFVASWWRGFKALLSQFLPFSFIDVGDHLCRMWCNLDNVEPRGQKQVSYLPSMVCFKISSHQSPLNANVCP